MHRERDPRSVSAERDLPWCPNVEQALVDRAVELLGRSHGAPAYLLGSGRMEKFGSVSVLVPFDAQVIRPIEPAPTA
jgi:hypothetical protein